MPKSAANIISIEVKHTMSEINVGGHVVLLTASRFKSMIRMSINSPAGIVQALREPHHGLWSFLSMPKLHV